MRFVRVAAALFAAVCIAAGASARADDVRDYARALRNAAAQLRAAARTPAAAAPIVHVPPAPAPGPPRFSPSLDDWLQAELNHPMKRVKARKLALREIAATLESLAAAAVGGQGSAPRVNAMREARAILSDPAYQSTELSEKVPPKTWWQRFIEWLAGIFDRMFRGVFRAATVAPKLSETLAIAVLAAVALALIVVVYRLVRAYFVSRPRRKLEEVGQVIGPAQQARTLYAAACEAAARRHYARAVVLLFQAALVALDRAGIAHFDPARTAGEYRRVVRRAGGSAYAPFDRLAQTFTFAAYAERPTGEAEWHDADRAYQALEPIVEGPES